MQEVAKVPEPKPVSHSHQRHGSSGAARSHGPPLRSSSASRASECRCSPTSGCASLETTASGDDAAAYPVFQVCVPHCIVVCLWVARM